MEELTRRQRKLLKKEEQGKAEGKSLPIRHVRHVILLIVAVGIIGLLYAGIRYLIRTTPAKLYTDQPIHWHAAFEVDLCGKKQDFSSYGSGEHHAGLPLLHTHGDGVIHVEGRILKPEDIMLGRFFDSISIPFDRDRIMDKKNGDECSPGKPGSVKMLVNGEPNNDFRNYVIKGTEERSQQRITIIFE